LIDDFVPKYNEYDVDVFELLRTYYLYTMSTVEESQILIRESSMIKYHTN